MKRIYVSPDVEISVIDKMDVITTSDWTLPEVPVDNTENTKNSSQFNW